MAKKILLTGATGFIGRNVLQKLVQSKDEIYLIVRPGTTQRITHKVSEFFEVDLTDTKAIKNIMEEHIFDVILHIGAIRGGRRFSKKTYFDANVNATEQLILGARKNNSKFVLCSSVGVFGAIPIELPANNLTKRQSDNYYHYTKIEAEKILQREVLYGLNGMIIRPAITYGEGDYGFPYTLTKLVDKKLLFLPNQPVKIHLTNINLISEAFVRTVDMDFEPGKAYNVADETPIYLHKLADFISEELKNKKYPNNRKIDKQLFLMGEKIARLFKNELWTARFELISKSWYYDVEDFYNDFKLKKINTIPHFKIVTDWYKKLKG